MTTNEKPMDQDTIRVIEATAQRVVIETLDRTRVDRDNSVRIIATELVETSRKETARIASELHAETTRVAQELKDATSQLESSHQAAMTTFVKDSMNAHQKTCPALALGNSYMKTRTAIIVALIPLILSALFIYVASHLQWAAPLVK